nr:hypothetical protein GCM10020185_54210 [Pseudomonas brassicacearum subsp. brassicacearum]
MTPLDFKKGELDESFMGSGPRQPLRHRDGRRAPDRCCTAKKPAIEEYTYSTHLDIAKVISMSEIPNVCEVVPAKMEYDDSKGQRHILRYSVMGNGCSNG